MRLYSLSSTYSKIPSSVLISTSSFSPVSLECLQLEQHTPPCTTCPVTVVKASWTWSVTSTKCQLTSVWQVFQMPHLSSCPVGTSSILHLLRMAGSAYILTSLLSALGRNFKTHSPSISRGFPPRLRNHNYYIISHYTMYMEPCNIKMYKSKNSQRALRCDPPPFSLDEQQEAVE